MIAHLRAGLPRWLPAFLPKQRWFGAKARTISSCTLDDAVMLDGEPETALAICGVDYADAGRHQYALLLSRRRDPGILPRLGQLDGGGDWIVEASADPRAASALLRGFSTRSRHPSAEGGELLHADAGPSVGSMLAGPDAGPVPMGAEQSNTTLRVGRSFIFKLVRRLEPGENPDVEVGRFLTSRTRFRRMPPLEGSITYRAASGEAYTIGMLQGWVESDGDGWAWVLDRLSAGADAGIEDPASSLAEEMKTLGRATAEFHAALASDAADAAFAPEPITRRDTDGWIREVHDLNARTLDHLRPSLSTLEPATRDLAARWIDRAAIEPRFAPPLNIDAATGVVKIRVHGDFHLGQTLKVAAGFLLIDFEGEPARALADRRRKTCALRDVAGMLRSFDYAVETAAQRAGGGAPPQSAGLRAPFLDGYFDAARSSHVPLHPGRRDERDRWLTFFEYSKALYELEYEINNRPDWVAIPLRGLLRMRA